MKKVVFLKISILSVAFLCLCFLFCGIFGNVNNASTPLLKYCIVIDAGHGGIDGGVEGYSKKTNERDINLEFALKLGNLFEAMSVNVIYTRTSTEGLYDPNAKNKKVDDMQKRINIIKNNNANLVISLHQNGYNDPSQRGIMAFYKHGQDASKNLAETLQTRFKNNIEHSRAQALVGDYFILNECDALCVLVECGFLTNPEEEQLLQSEDYQNKICFEIFAGCIQYLVTKGEICLEQ